MKPSFKINGDSNAIWKRISYVLMHVDDSVEEFEAKTEIDWTAAKERVSGGKEITHKEVLAVLQAYPEVSPSWLAFGIGPHYMWHENGTSAAEISQHLLHLDPSLPEKCELLDKQLTKANAKIDVYKSTLLMIFQRISPELKMTDSLRELLEPST